MLQSSISSRSTVRLIEGGSEEFLNLRLSESPSDKCETGKSCMVRVKVQLHGDPVTTPRYMLKFHILLDFKN